MARTIRTLAAVAGAVVALSLTACSDDGDEPQRDESGQVTESAGAADIFDVKVGDCVGDFEDEDEVTDVSVVPCADEHAQEVFASAEIPDGDFPGDDALREQAQEECAAEFATFVGTPWPESELDYTWLQPTEESWSQGDRELICLVYDPAGPVTGSLEGAGR